MYRMDPGHTGRSGFALPRNPRVALRVPLGSMRISTQPVALDETRVLVGSHDGRAYAVDLLREEISWRFHTGDRIYSTALVHRRRAFLGSDADRFFALTPRAGGLDVGLATEDDADTSAVPAPDGTLRFAAGRAFFATAPDLTVRWRLDMTGKVFSSPAMMPDGTAVFGSQDDRVYAVDGGGAVRWQFVAGADVDATPALYEGTVYVGSDDGRVYALDANDGSVRWRHSVGGFVRAGIALGLDGSLVVGTFGPSPRVVALDRSDGHERWSVAVPGPPTRDYGVASSAVVDREGRYAVGVPDDAVWILARDGSVEARVRMPADVDSSPILMADRVLVVGCDDGALYVLADEGAGVAAPGPDDAGAGASDAAQNAPVVPSATTNPDDETP